MFLELAHTKLDIYQVILNFTKECYQLSRRLPADEKFNMVQQLRRAALSVHLNNAEGSSRKSIIERKRFYEIARGSIIEIDAILDIAAEMEYLQKKNLENLGISMIQAFKMLTGMINAIGKNP